MNECVFVAREAVRRTSIGLAARIIWLKERDYVSQRSNDPQSRNRYDGYQS